MTEIKKANKNNEENNNLKMPKEMEIGFHQGSINSLLNERNSLVNMIHQIENIIQAHIKRLEELGVKIKTNSEKRE